MANSESSSLRRPALIFITAIRGSPPESCLCKMHNIASVAFAVSINSAQAIARRDESKFRHG